jgi:hypothetical protein
MARFLLYALVVIGGVRISFAQVYLTRDEALQLAFPQGSKIDRKTLFLSDQQVEQIEKLARAKVESKVITYYAGKEDTGVVGYAFFETHVVRTMPETFMTVIAPDGTIKLVEILAFYEPEDYKPSKRWLDQFVHQGLSEDLRLKGSIRAISGATISAHAITDAVRRILATYKLAVRGN